MPETLIVDGYNDAFPTLGMVIAAVLVKDLVPVNDELTVTRNELLALACPSPTVNVIVAVPLCPAAGVNVTVRLLALPPRTMPALGTSVGFDELPLRVNPVAAVSTSPTVKPIGPTATPGEVVWAAIPEIVGRSFTAVTVTAKLLLVVNGPSLTLRVMVVVPFWFVAGVTVTVRLDPLPPNTMLFKGTRDRLDEALPRVRLPAAVSASPMVKLRAELAVSSFTVWSVMLVIVGGVLAASTVRIKLVLVVACPSPTLTVIVAVPLWLAAGVTVTVRLAPLPPNTIPVSGTRVGLDEPLLKVRLAAAVSTSPIVKPSAAVAESRLIV